MNNKIIFSIISTFYIFNSSIDLQYNNTKFKKIFIDLDILTRLIGNIGQFKILQQLNISIQLDKNITSSANFIFKIGNIIFIRLVILDIPIELITFHIVPVNTLFLLYLADINKFRAFFNNITY